MKKGLRRFTDTALAKQHETQTDLMKKGLRQSSFAYCPVSGRNTDRPDEEGIKTSLNEWVTLNPETQTDLMKKGLRLEDPILLLARLETQTDLMKKGLRLRFDLVSSSRSGNTDRPDEEGIKTCALARISLQVSETQTDLMKKGLRRA